jgi:hypothetical protein
VWPYFIETILYKLLLLFEAEKKIGVLFLNIQVSGCASLSSNDFQMSSLFRAESDSYKNIIVT